MEQLNRITLCGHVGASVVQNIGDSRMVRFSMATDHAYKNRQGEMVVEVTWHSVVAFEGDGMPDFDTIVKGAVVKVDGRLRQRHFSGPDGDKRTLYEVLASHVELVK